MISTGRKIIKTPGIQGGDACVEGTRIPVWVLDGYRRLGMTDEAILESYPSINPGDLVAAWEYADTHREEMEYLIRINEEGEEGFVE